MKTQHKKIAVVSASALTAGLANGAIIYTYANPSNPNSILSGGDSSMYIDLNQDGVMDFDCNFHSNNQNKPFIEDGVGIAQPNYTPFVLSDAVDGSSSQGLPLTAYGTPINASYESLQGTGFFNQDNSGTTVGGWNVSGTLYDGYVGLVLQDGGGNNYYGWAHFTYNNDATYLGGTGVIKLVDYAMETTANTQILAGENAESNSPPSVVIPPTSQTNGVGNTVQFTVITTANPAPTYQWEAGVVGSGVYTNLVDGGNIVGSTSNVLTISNISAANAADYVVAISNSVSGLVTPVPATLTVAAAAVTLSPVPVNLLAGGHVSIAANYSSPAPANSYQWYKGGVLLNNGGDISGATSSTLTISNAATSDSANYSVVVGNTYGMVTSAVDSVSVQTPSLAYDQAVTALNPVAYYRLDELASPMPGNAIAFDSFGGLNGTYGYQTANGNPTNNGTTGPDPALGFLGFASTNTALAITNSDRWSASAVLTPPLNLNTSNATFTAWIYPTETEPAYAVVMSCRSPVSGTASGINFDPGANGVSDGGLSYHWNDQQYSWSFYSGVVPPVNQWSLIALVISPTNTAFYVISSSGIQTTNQTAVNTDAPFTTPFKIGADGNDPNLVGDIDEVAIFNQSLTYVEITNLYDTAVSGTYTPPPPTIALKIQNLNVSWTPVLGTLQEATALTGPWTDVTTVSPYAVTPSQPAMFYRVKYTPAPSSVRSR